MSDRPGQRGAAGPFDLERIRRNWERAGEPPPPSMIPRFADVPAPRDAIVVGRDGLDRVRALVRAQLPDHVGTLAPFFAQAEGALERVAKAESGADTTADRDAFVETLANLEDLFEVFLGMGR